MALRVWAMLGAILGTSLAEWPLRGQTSDPVAADPAVVSDTPVEPVAQAPVDTSVDIERALKRAQYLLHGTVPTEEEFQLYTGSVTGYRARVREFLDSENFYDANLRYHERVLGIGLPIEYVDELLLDDIDYKTLKVASIECERRDYRAGNGGGEDDGRLRCFFLNDDNSNERELSCSESELQAVSTFWYPGVVAWVCPTVARTCGGDLSRCFIQYGDRSVALNSEMGATEQFDTRVSVAKSLAKQAAGLATAVVVGNYPYTDILRPGLTAMDGALAHFFRQSNHFDFNKLRLSGETVDLAQSVPITNTRFRLLNSSEATDQAGVLSTWGWLRRYEKNRTRANELYQRLLCQEFTSELPRVFPQDPGNLRETPGCAGCHSVLDPLADFFLLWGEGGDLYGNGESAVQTTFGGRSGTALADLSTIIREENAFASCTVQNVWQWLMGREFYRNEAELRAALTSYFVQTNYSFKELVYALATHPAFMMAARADATVGDPLAQPPLGQPPGISSDAPCPDRVLTYAEDIEPRIASCTSCHSSGVDQGQRQDLTTEAQWLIWADTAVSMMASGNMPPGQTGPPRSGDVFDFKEAVRCWAAQENGP